MSTKRTFLPILFAVSCLLPSPSCAEDELAGDSTKQEVETRSENTAAAHEAALQHLFREVPGEGSAAAKAAEAGNLLNRRVEALEALEGAGGLIDQDLARFLRMRPASEEAVREYAQKTQAIRRLLGQRQIAEAWEGLLGLADYRWDEGMSYLLAARIESIWDADATAADVLKDNQRLRDAINQANWNADSLMDSLRRNAHHQRSTRSGRTDGEGFVISDNELASEPMEGLAGRMRMTEEYFKGLDARARVKLNELRLENMDSAARADFEDLISTLFQSGHHLHAILGFDFYRVMFGDGKVPASLANQVAASREIRRRVRQSAEVVEREVLRGNIRSAGQILAANYDLGRHHPEFYGLSEGAREEVYDYFESLRRMKSYIENQDYDELEGLLAEMDGKVKDFEGTKARSLIRQAQMQSRMHLGRARLAAQNGEEEQALEHFRLAAEAWPGNPELDTAAEGFFASQDRANQGVAEFDRVFQRGEYRTIAEQQLPFLAAVQGDADREERLREALETVRDAEMAVERANILSRNGDVYGAWESLQKAALGWPEDETLGRLRSELALEAIDLVRALNQAERAEDRGHTGLALSWYINAQREYASSEFAGEGIERLTGRIFETTPRREAAEVEDEELPRDEQARDRKPPEDGEG